MQSRRFSGVWCRRDELSWNDSEQLSVDFETRTEAGLVKGDDIIKTPYAPNITICSLK